MVFDRSWEQRVEKEFQSQMRAKGKMPVPMTVAREHKLREQTSIGRVFPREVDSPASKGLAQYHEHKAMKDQLKARLAALEQEVSVQRDERRALQGKVTALREAKQQAEPATAEA